MKMRKRVIGNNDLFEMVCIFSCMLWMAILSIGFDLTALIEN